MLLWIVFCYSSLAIVSSLSDVSVEFPNPQKEHRKCGRQNDAFVCDPDFILDLGDAEKLNQLAGSMKTSTSCLCSRCPDNLGIPIGIFLRNNISDKTLSENSGFMLADKIRQAWTLGTCDDDIIIVLIIQSNTLGFSLGASVQNILTEEMATRIMNDCQVHFDSGYYYQGLESIVSSFNDVIIGEQRNNSKGNSNLMLGLLIGLAIVLALVAGCLAVHFRQVKRRKKSCSNIYVNEPNNQDRKNVREDQKEQLEKLNQVSSEEK